MLDGVAREELQRDRDVAEGEVEVDQAHLAGAPVGERERQVDRDGGLADAALGREDGDDPALVHRAAGTPERDVQLVGTVDGRLDQVGAR